MAEHRRLILAGMDDDHIAVLRSLTDGEVVYPATHIAEQAGLPLDRTRRILRNLRTAGLAQHGPLFNDGMLVGSGTFLTFAGENVLREMEEANG